MALKEQINITQPFPVDISYGSSSTPTYNTDVVTVVSGVETRNQNWAQSRHSYDVAFGIRNQGYLNSLIEFFHVCKGKLEPFLYKDWTDYKSAELITEDDQYLGTGDDTTKTFQLVKNYTVSGVTTRRIINRPVGTGVGNSTVLIGKNGNRQIEGSNYTIDYTTGVVYFISAPALDDIITAGYEFWVPCRFEEDTLTVNMEMYEHGNVSVPLIEVRL